jgi:DNA-binding SARP family transcriptional activator
MSLNDGPGDCEPLTRSLANLFGGEERFENPGTDSLRDAATGAGDRDICMAGRVHFALSVTRPPLREISHCSSAEGQPPKARETHEPEGPRTTVSNRMERLEIRLLGGFQLGRDGRVLDQLPLRAARSLFAFLVLNRERAHTRDLLAGTFWPDFDESRARRRLSQALWQTQTALGKDDGERFLIGTPDTIRFNAEADFWLDVDEFNSTLDDLTDGDRSMETEALTRAVALYRGDLLAGFYDDWLFPDQDRLRTRFLGALERLADLAMARGDYETALTLSRRLAQENEFDEEAHRRVMRVAVLLGRHNEALRQFEECRRILSEELGTTPSAETLELYEATVADRDAGSRTTPAHEESLLFGDAEAAPFVGREPERARFAQRLDEVLEGKGGIILVEGESGVGKTRLLREVADDARWRGMDVIWGRSAPSGGRPFGPIGDALRTGLSDLRIRQLQNRLDDTRLAALAPLIPRLAPDAEPEVAMGMADEQARMQEAIGAAFQGLAATNPTLVVLEDVHWSDEDTIHTLSQLAHRVQDQRILFAVTYRHGEARERPEVWDLLRTLDRLEHCERVSLAALTPAQAEELIRKSLGLSDVSGGFSERLHRETGGIPLFLVETLRALYERDSLNDAQVSAEDLPWVRDQLPVAPTVHALIRHRLDALQAVSRKTLELVAAHDGSLLVTEIVDASDLTDAGTLDAIDDLQKRRFIDGDPDGFSLEHELVRRVVYDDLQVPRRLDLHRRIAQSVESHRPDEVEVLAHHFKTARISDRAADYLERAAQKAIAVHAYDTAAQHLSEATSALDEIAAPSNRRYAVSALHEEVLDVLGRREDQEHVLRRLSSFAGSEHKGEVLRRRAWLLAHQDEFDQAVGEAERALAAAHEAGDPGGIVSALTALGMIACYGGRAAEGVLHLEAAAEFRDTDPHLEANARNALGQNLIDLQRFGEAESQLLTALRLYGEIGDARGQAEVSGMLGTLRMERGEPGAAEADFMQAIETSQRVGYRHGEAVYRMNLAILFIITNRLGEALHAFEEAEEKYGALDNSRGRALVLSNAAWLWHGLIGDDAKATDQVAEALAIYKHIGDSRGIAQCHGLMGSLAGRSGDLDGGRTQFDEALRLTRLAEDAWLTAQALRELAAIELENGAIDSGLEHILEAESICRDYGMNDLLVGVRALAGRLALRAGRTEDALDLATRAMREIRPGVELAHLVPLALSEVYGKLGNDEEAAHHITLAHDQLEMMLGGLDADLRHRSWTAIPNHRDIQARWSALQPRTRDVRLAATSASLGRAVRPSEWIDVVWTVHQPSDECITGAVERRRHQLMRLIDEAAAAGASPTVADLTDALDASDATIRRDIGALRDAGHTIATRGSR